MVDRIMHALVLQKMTRRIFLILLSAIMMASCMKNFDPETESDTSVISLEVDAMPIVTGLPFYGTDDLIKDGEIPDEYKEIAKMRLTAYCYDREGKLVMKQSVSRSSVKEKVMFKFDHLNKKEEYTFVATGEFFELGEHGTEIDFWYPMLTGTMESFHLERTIGPGGMFDLFGCALTSARPQAQTVGLSLEHAGTYCHLTYEGCGNVSEIHISYSGLYMFSPTGNEKYCGLGDFYNTMQTGSDILHQCLYIIPGNDGMTTLKCSISYKDGNADPLECNSTFHIEDKKPKQIKINCQNGTITCIE